MNELGNMIDPIAGIGVEDIWLSGRDTEVKYNDALSKIMADEELQDIIEEVVIKHNTTSKSVVTHHFMIALLEGWNHKLNRNKKYRAAQPEIEHAVKLRKSIVKTNFKKLIETESRESIHYRYGVVFYRKYTYNLYQTAFAIISWIFFPVAYYIFLQRQPYFESLDELTEDLNQSDNSSPIHLDDFEVGKISPWGTRNEDLQMELNYNYLTGKIDRTMFWIILALFWGVVILWFSFSFDETNLILLVMAVLFLMFLIHKIFLYVRLRKLHPKYILKIKGLWR
jgi:hypothetical protein